MKDSSYFRFIVFTIGGIAFSAAIFLQYYIVVLFDQSVRTPSPEFVDGRYLIPYTMKFFDRKDTARPNELVLGDSQFFGYKMPDDLSFAYLLQNHSGDTDVINLSSAGTSPAVALRVLEELEKKGVRFERLYYNFNLQHYSLSQASNLQRNIGVQSELPTFPFYLLTLVRKELKAKFRRSRKGIRFTEFEYMDLPQNYFKTSPEINPLFRKLVDKMVSMSKESLIILSPHCKDQFVESKFDSKQFKTDVRRYGLVAEKLGAKVYDLSFALKKDSFVDLVHLSKKGHENMFHILSDPKEMKKYRIKKKDPLRSIDSTR